MRHNRSILAATALSLFLALTVAGCGDSDSDNSEQTAPPLDLGTGSGSDIPESEAMPAASHDPLIVRWCSVKSGRDEASCKCILSVVEGAIDNADYLILSEVAKADLAEGSSEEAIEAEFNGKYGADRMTGIMETFVSTRTAAEKTCLSSTDRSQDPQGT